MSESPRFKVGDTVEWTRRSHSALPYGTRATLIAKHDQPVGSWSAKYQTAGGDSGCGLWYERDFRLAPEPAGPSSSLHREEEWIPKEGDRVHNPVCGAGVIEKVFPILGVARVCFDVPVRPNEQASGNWWSVAFNKLSPVEPEEPTTLRERFFDAAVETAATGPSSVAMAMHAEVAKHIESKRDEIMAGIKWAADEVESVELVRSILLDSEQ